MDTSIIVSIIGLAISTISVSCAIYFSSKNSKAADTKEVERRVAERTETNIKLDNISKNTDDIKQNLTPVQRDLQKHAEKIVEVESSAKQAHHRIDTLESRFNMKNDE